MEAIALTGIITGITGLTIAILTHIKHSECSKCFSLDTRSPPQSATPCPPPSPIPEKKIVSQQPEKELEVSV